MFCVFAKLREIGLLYALAGGFPGLRARLMPPDGWTIEAVLLLDMGALRRELVACISSGRRERLAHQRRKSLS
jgi:hypothetical protein